MEQTFQELSEISNILGYEHIKQFFGSDCDILEEENQYSANDFIIKKDGNYYIIEVKTRKTLYSNFMIERKKINNLKRKKKQYEEEGIKIKDIYYLSIYFTKGFIWSFNELSYLKKETFNKVMSLPETNQFFIDNPTTTLLITKTKCKYSTAYSSNNKMIEKDVMYLHIDTAKKIII